MQQPKAPSTAAIGKDSFHQDNNSAPVTSRRLSLSNLAIRQHIATLVLTVTVIVLGLFVIQQIPVDLLPSITYPRIGVRADAPGVSPEVAVDEVTRPLEEALSATEGFFTNPRRKHHFLPILSAWRLYLPGPKRRYSHP